MAKRFGKTTASTPSLGEQLAATNPTTANIPAAKRRRPQEEAEKPTVEAKTSNNIQEEADPLAGGLVADDLKIVHPKFRKKKRTRHSTSIRLPAKTMDIITMYRNSPQMQVDRPEDPTMSQSEFLRMLIDHSLYQLQVAMTEGDQEAIEEMLAWVPGNDEED